MRKIAILGYGTVGSGVGLVLEEGRRFIEQRIGDSIEVTYVLDLRDFPGDPFEDRVVRDINIILNDPQIEVVVETMGGLHPAFDFVSAALKAGKSVVTSNKQLVEAKGSELGRLARENNVTFLYEASVAGGIPIIRLLNTSLWHEEIRSISGVLNGTTNFILEQMEKYSLNFDEALKMAQERGYAERDPRADIEGLDAARKIAILAGLICDHHVPFEQIPTKGITEVTLGDMIAASSLGGKIKLVASFGFLDEAREQLVASVEPMFVPKTSPLYMVDSVFNAVLVHSKMLDDTMYYGRGAGKHATASAVVSDIMACLTGVSSKEMVMWDDVDVEVHSGSQVDSRYLVIIAGEKPYLTEVLTCAQAQALKDQCREEGKKCSLYRALQSNSMKEE